MDLFRQQVTTTIDWRVPTFRSIQKAIRTLGCMAMFALAGTPVSSASPSGYVYVAVPAASCAQASPCALPQVLVVDAATAEVATRIDLPVHTVPPGIALSPDGTRLYVSNFGAEFGAFTSLTVIDARHHVVLKTFSLPLSGPLAVGPKAERVFLLGFVTLYAIDASTNEQIGSVSVTPPPNRVAVSGPLNRVFVGGGNFHPSATIHAYDPDTLAAVARSNASGVIDFSVSRDGLRLFDIEYNPFRPSNVIFGDEINAATLAPLRHYSASFMRVPPPIELGADELLVVTRGAGPFGGFVRRFFLSGGGSSAEFPTLPNFLDFTLPSPGNRLFALHESTGAATSNLLAVIDINSYSLVTTIPLSRTARLITSTPWGVPSCSYSLNRTYVPLARTTPTAAVSLTTDCSWTASTTESWIHLSTTAGTGNATLTFTLDPNTGPSPREGTVILGGQPIRVRQASFAFGPPFGVMDTPADGAAVQGSIAVTGWAMDDIAVRRVELWRDLQPGETTVPFAGTATDPRSGKVFIDNAAFVDGARPDVAILYPSLPLSSRAGWGYLLLTWGLPNRGNGAFTLYAYAVDQESNIALIGSKAMVANNNAAIKPFGAIDTPEIGGDASGPNFGWALTPPVNGIATCRVPASGVQVSIDSGPLQPVMYGDARPDVAARFQGFANADAAGGHFFFDWSTLSTGPHTIGWLVTDDCGRAEGIGSRFFNVTTGTMGTSQTAQAGTPDAMSAMRAASDGERESAESVFVRRGNSEFEQQVSIESGFRVVDLRAGERMRIRLPDGFSDAYQIVAGRQRGRLPIGSTWDAASATFYWQPAPGFLGSFVIVFSNGPERISVRVQITP
jgi:DNA-binding beta-propeller fold protein YncE